MHPVSPICASTVEQTAELPGLWLPPRRRNGDCNRPTTSASANTNMWYPHVAEQCLLLHPLASLSDLRGHGVLVHGSGGFARCMFQPYTVRAGSWPSFPSGEYSFDRLVLIQWRFPDLLASLQLHDTVLSLSRQDLLIRLVFYCFLRFSISSRSIERSTTLLLFTSSFFFALATNAFHLLIHSSHGVHLTNGIRCRGGHTRNRQVHRNRQKEQTTAGDFETTWTQR
jgi:hypothetical protein